MDLRIEAVCYDLGIPDDEAGLYSFVHGKIIEYGGPEQFRQNVAAERGRISAVVPSEIYRFVLDFSGLDKIVADAPFDMEHIAAYKQQLLRMLEDSGSLEERLRIYEEQILPRWREYTEDMIIGSLRRKYETKRGERRAFEQRMKGQFGT